MSIELTRPQVVTQPQHDSQSGSAEFANHPLSLPPPCSSARSSVDSRRPPPSQCVNLLNAKLIPFIPTQLRKTPLYDFHVQNGGKMVPFAGYSMPLSYGDVGQGEFAMLSENIAPSNPPVPVVASHNHVRSSVGLFDVGHMVQSNFRGPTAQPFLEWLTPSPLGALSPYSSTLSVLLNQNGGIIDDTIITKHAEDAFYVVTNAGRRERDLGWFSEKIDEWNNGERAKRDGPVEMEVLDGWGLVALQGILFPFLPADLAHTFHRSSRCHIPSIPHFLRPPYPNIRQICMDSHRRRVQPTRCPWRIHRRRRIRNLHPASKHRGSRSGPALPRPRPADGTRRPRLAEVGSGYVSIRSRFGRRNDAARGWSGMGRWEGEEGGWRIHRF